MGMGVNEEKLRHMEYAEELRAIVAIKYPVQLVWLYECCELIQQQIPKLWNNGMYDAHKAEVARGDD